jgi:hypothetical protein
MYAVTGSAREYADRQQQESGEVRLYLIEECEVENDGGGWEIYWYNDGTAQGTLLMEVWGSSGDSAGLMPVVLSEDDVFSEKEQETLREREETRVPAPFGVRYRTVTEAEFWTVEDWDDLDHLMTLGSVSKRYWDIWEQRLCA